jgi:BirA family transcriptional regulator, biotin operon repressor / biotin---[acetyl-CoA-carboxylase] ligase
LPDPPFHQPIGTPFIELQTIDSTNNYALSLIHAARLPDLPTGQAEGQVSPQHGLVVFSHAQTAGKGQRGKKWVSSPGINIALSIVINPTPLQVSQQFQLSACTAVALQEFFGKYAGTETKIKWPNDLYWRDRKAGGVLIESVVSSRVPIAIGTAVSTWDWAVVGIGININQTSFPGELPNPVSLKQITGKTYDSIELARELCRVFNDQYEKLMNAGFEAIYQQYQTHLYKKGEKVKLKKDNRVFEATIKTVSPAGKLIVDHVMEEEFDFGSVEWLIEGK